MSKQKLNYLYLTGKDGLYHTTFPSSPKGQKGEPGLNGTNGVKGDRGDKGTAGTPGHMTQIVGSWSTNSSDNLPLNGTFPVGWDDGVNPPIPFDVEIGETMYNTTTHELWTYTPGSTVSGWTYLGNAASIKGQTGTKGATGGKGLKGDIGEQGLDGDKGTKGQKGDDGLAGTDGTKGEKGDRGPQGVRGPAGSNGTKGNSGDGGIDGTDGVDGIKGQKGEGGEKGRRGVMGPRGLKGETGDPGEARWFPRLAASFNGETLEVFDAFGLLSIDKLQVGEYRVNFATALSNNRFTCVASSSRENNIVVKHRRVDSVTLKVKDLDGNLDDTDYISLIIYKYAS